MPIYYISLFCLKKGFENLNENLIIKYQLFKDNEIKNFIIPIDLNLFNNQEIEDNGIEFSSIYELFYNLKLDETVVKELKIDDLKKSLPKNI